ncbi:hypothetical protein KBZ15_15010 [Cyanobium sp. BA20m-p-22]|uniref:hypothetical protein n=1 Tax=Cyanobium sp. BA20m-p-22 TaxID=2823704 RepID=UPI0020CDC024|nr:hypothetical protein [Cyanobium sp. BA20m-p-22]MCP9911201.1 hypothetical protein [Cyanobium sp. BA20m-p-22]
MGWIFDAAMLLGEGAVMGMAEEQSANKKLVVCRSCHAEAERNNAYCSMCGSHELVRKDKFLKELENPRFQERCHPFDPSIRGLEDMTNAPIQRGR